MKDMSEQKVEWKTEHNTDRSLDMHTTGQGRRGRIIWYKQDTGKNVFGGFGRLVHTGRGTMYDYYQAYNFETVEEAKEFIEECFKKYSPQEVFFWRANLRRDFLTQFLEVGDCIVKTMRELVKNYKYSITKLMMEADTEEGISRSVGINEYTHTRDRLSRTLGLESQRAYKKRLRLRKRSIASIVKDN